MRRWKGLTDWNCSTTGDDVFLDSDSLGARFLVAVASKGILQKIITKFQRCGVLLEVTC